MSKKLLSVILALALVASCFAMGAFAIGGLGFEEDEEAANYTQTWNLGAPVDNGNGTYSVDVKLQAVAAAGYEYLVGPIEFQLIKDITAGTLRLTNAVAGPVVEETWGEQGIDCDVSFSDASGKVMIIPTPSDDALSGLDLSTEKVIATLTFQASADVAASVKINIEDAKTAENPDGTLFAARMSDGNVVTGTAVVGQTVTPNTTPANFGAVTPPSEPPVLVPIDGTLGVVDTTRTDLDADFEGTSCDGYLYGWDSEGDHSISELFEVIGDGDYNVIPNEEGSECATGTMVQVVDFDGNVVAEYVVIIFGDVNGDGAADSNDASNIELHENYELGENGQLVTYLQFAADVNCDGAADSNDASNIELHENYELGDNGRIDIEAIISEIY